MAKKSKTQRAKASAKRADKKAAPETLAPGQAEAEAAEAAKIAEGEQAEAAKKTKAAKAASTPAVEDRKKSAKKAEPKAKKSNFFTEVRSELKRVTWPSRTDVIRWSGVVVVALLFFGIFTALMDTVVLQVLTAYSGLAG